MSASHPFNAARLQRAFHHVVAAAQKTGRMRHVLASHRNITPKHPSEANGVFYELDGVVCPAVVAWERRYDPKQRRALCVLSIAICCTDIFTGKANELGHAAFWDCLGRFASTWLSRDGICVGNDGCTVSMECIPGRRVILTYRSPSLRGRSLCVSFTSEPPGPPPLASFV